MTGTTAVEEDPRAARDGVAGALAAPGGGEPRVGPGRRRVDGPA